MRPMLMSTRDVSAELKAAERTSSASAVELLSDAPAGWLSNVIPLLDAPSTLSDGTLSTGSRAALS